MMYCVHKCSKEIFYVCYMMNNNYAGLCLSPLQKSLCVAWRLAFLFFDYCYFYRDTQWEPLQRREGLCLSLRAAGYEFELHRKLEEKKTRRKETRRKNNRTKRNS